jgi:hypothetical protein
MAVPINPENRSDRSRRGLIFMLSKTDIFLPKDHFALGHPDLPSVSLCDSRMGIDFPDLNRLRPAFSKAGLCISTNRTINVSLTNSFVR